MANVKDLLLTVGTGVAIVLIVNWLVTPKPPQWPANYGFAGYSPGYSPIMTDGELQMESIDDGRLSRI